jgi:peptidoglycan/xylan/chitin deacetylase (PgdA/CDA1 family)
MSSLANALRAGAGALLRLVPTTVWKALFPKPHLGVCWHMVADAAPPHLKHYRVLTPAQFKADLDHLQAQFGVMSYRELEERRAALPSVRDNHAVLSFDDGFSQCAEVIAPILKARGLDAVFFVITDLIDNRIMFREAKAALCIEAVMRMPAGEAAAVGAGLGLPAPPKADLLGAPDALNIAGLDKADRRLKPLLHWLLTLPAQDEALLDRVCARLGVKPEAYLREVRPYVTADQIKALHHDGFTIGAHSRSHRFLQDLPRDEAEREVVESCRVIRDLTGQKTVPFAFPYSGRGLDRAWLSQLRARHPVIGLYFDTSGVIEDAPFVVQRVFGERFGRDRTLDATIRRAWAIPSAWKR